MEVVVERLIGSATFVNELVVPPSLDFQRLAALFLSTTRFGPIDEKIFQLVKRIFPSQKKINAYDVLSKRDTTRAGNSLFAGGSPKLWTAR